MAVNLQKSFSSLNEHLAKQFDGAGVHRSFTVPFVEGQPTADHVASVGQAAATAGGITGNLITSAHRAGGKGYGSGDGETAGHPVQKLKETVIPKDDENAKASILATQKHLNNIKSLLGDNDPTVQTAQSQLDLVKKTDGAGMNLFDFGVMLQQLVFAPLQAVARAHNDTKPTGPGYPKLSGPVAQSDDSAQPSGAAPAPDAGAAPAAPDASATPEAPAPQGQ